jgi:flagellar protein FliT
MDISSLDALLSNLLSLTLSLEKIVIDEESEPEAWIALLDQRQEVMDQLSALFADGVSVTDTQKQTYLQPSYEADQRIVPIMDRKKKEVEIELANVQKSKAANRQYVEYGNAPSPYGAFFDKKK